MIAPWLILLLTAAGAAVLWRSRGASASGMVAGCALTAWFAARGGWPLFTAWTLMVLLGLAVSRRGYAAKAERAVAQPGEARRSARHALANAGVAALALAAIEGEPGRIAGIGALATALADTASGELGMLSRATPRLLLFGRRCPAGTDGGMTWAGTLEGLGAGSLVAAAVLPWMERPGATFLAVTLGAFSGNLADSLLGATIEGRLPRGFHNEIVNFAATLVGAVVAALTFRGLGP